MNITSNHRILCPSLTISHNKDSRNFDFITSVIVCIINGLLVLPTTFLNLLIILGILRNPYLRKPSYLLICALAFTDFGVGVLLQPLFIVRKVALFSSRHDIYCTLVHSGNILAHLVCSPSFFIVTVISIDRYLAIRLQTRYNHIVTVKTVLKFLIGCMVSAVAVTLARLQATKPGYMGIAAALMFILLIVILSCYFASINTLKIHQRQMDNIQESILVQTAQYKRTLKTLLIIVFSLFLCYIPFVGVVIAIAFYGRNKTLTIAWECTSTLLYLNSYLNPLLHLWRCKELRRSCLSMLRSIWHYNE
ncbi:melanocyte-stimulating hormone receptor-like [Exaiptasia diaphana]|uniref:G-protein coupled receptors family 1 profile domain-containing protein n=1 Tax=Exaiptasia diaphana TaxID=2652724 RepID=A0A913Y470_EXADI|nr:melanocyte-stimulating hormone receptor-like [Exaiptasia diaphana]